MIKFSKTVLLILIMITSTSAGASMSLVKWDNVDSFWGCVKEFHLTILLVAIALYFVFPYVKKLKE